VTKISSPIRRSESAPVIRFPDEALDLLHTALAGGLLPFMIAMESRWMAVWTVSVGQVS
jgi:hypothetical protein